MSAIAGLWHLDGRPDAAELLDGMQRALTPYGPDRRGEWSDGDVALGGRLMTLLPEDAHDRQPLVGGGGRFVLVADLRLDNRPELWEALGIDRRQGAAMADSDLLLAAWERWEEACPARLVGNFAFAVWDRRDRRLHLVRDQMGGRPLFHHHRPGRIAFASMYPGLHALPDVPMAPDLGAVRAHAGYFADFGERSYHAGIKRVMPGTRMTIDADGRVHTDRYWDLPDPAPLRLRSDAEYVEAFRECFDRAARDRLRAIGPFGAHLSSGYDSSAVVGTVAPMLAERGQRLSAYTAVPMAGVTPPSLPHQIIDEGGVAAITAARHPNVDHFLVGQDGRAFGEDMDVNFANTGEPIRNLCNHVWRIDIARRMRERGERVLLNGIFGNLTISYKGMERLPELLTSGRWARLLREARGLERDGMPRRSVLKQTIGPLLPEPWIAMIARLTGRRIETRREYSALSDAALAAIHAEEREGRWEGMVFFGVGSATRRDRLRVGLYQRDVGALGKGMLAAFGTDERDISRDTRFIELILALPDDLFLRDGQARWIYRQAFADRVPPDVMIPVTRKGYQSGDWMHRLHKGRDRLNAVLERATGIPEIEAMFDMGELRRLAMAELDFSQAHLPAVRNTLRFRYLSGVSNIDFLLRAGVAQRG